MSVGLNTFFKMTIIWGLINTKVCYAECPDQEWHRYSNTCYLVKPGKQEPFDVAEQDCTSEGGSLAILRQCSDSMEVIDVIRRIDVTEGEKSYVWIGLQKRDTQWLWVNGTQPVWYNWAPGEPSIPADVTDVCVEIDPTYGRWHASPCDLYRHFVCRYDIVPLPSLQRPDSKKNDANDGLTIVEWVFIAVGVFLVIGMITMCAIHICRWDSYQAPDMDRIYLRETAPYSLHTNMTFINGEDSFRMQTFRQHPRPTRPQHSC